MTTPINLTAFREQATSEWAHEDGNVVLRPDEVLALIDTAEAAIAYEKQSWSHTDPPAKRRLRETLTRYTTNQP